MYAFSPVRKALVTHGHRIELLQGPSWWKPRLLQKSFLYYRFANPVAFCPGRIGFLSLTRRRSRNFRSALLAPVPQDNALKQKTYHFNLRQHHSGVLFLGWRSFNTFLKLKIVEKD